MYYLSEDLFFPPVHLAHYSGIIGLGGDLSPELIAVAQETNHLLSPLFRYYWLRR